MEIRKEKAFNFHYQNVGYHPLLCYDAFTKDLIGATLREGSKYCSKDAADFLRPIFEEYTESYPDINCMLRGDSGFLLLRKYMIFVKNMMSAM